MIELLSTTIYAACQGYTTMRSLPLHGLHTELKSVSKRVGVRWVALSKALTPEHAMEVKPKGTGSRTLGKDGMYSMMRGKKGG